MKPVRTRASNFVYRGPTPDIGDAWVERVTVVGKSAKLAALPSDTARLGFFYVVGPVGVVYMDWQPSEAERDAIASGKGVVRLGIWGMEPIPPVSLEVRPDIEIVDTDPPPIVESV